MSKRKSLTMRDIDLRKLDYQSTINKKTKPRSKKREKALAKMRRKDRKSNQAESFNFSTQLVPFIDNLVQLTQVCEDSVKGSIKQCLNDNQSDLQFFSKIYIKTLLERLEAYTKAMEILQASGVKFEHPVEWGLSLQSEHKKYLAQEYCKSAVFVTDYPNEFKPFYMKLNLDGETVACFDLLPHIGELSGSSMRKNNYVLILLEILENKNRGFKIAISRKMKHCSVFIGKLICWVTMK
ncbi:hypothetical protein CONCODRAFT_68454 [Conidiobolus coronatus NRRL 28638]|uniref:Aminoacyl-tRNA synthetase class II (D/K/N) domain-containing protein n=1 Tax=Conidiobolus coronatus (strain ATCC 28846 / CBS 209.66 / NRRL 28638) TaxID=796925 RepID=A0A137PDZ2_CONC2|nr:hypothetical protein CONCODRAFT_68454 [Conidiobolus coronatus NRRL 28638]|eukprot:KXN73185.1 hypothetical protein CONCODRAFT_68454 [Conidiobolus coronatus NRRL 28638]